VSDFCFALIAWGNACLPKRHELVLHSFPDVEDQLVAVFRWLRDHPERALPTTLLVSGSEEEARGRLRLLVGPFIETLHIKKKSKFSAVWHYWRARYVFFTHGLYGFRPANSHQCVINLWHGMPLKRVWRGLKGSHIPQCTWLLSTSEKFSEIQASASGFGIGMIPAIGLPRNDLLFSRTDAALQFGSNIRKGCDRVVLFLPTYRQSKAGFITEDGVETANSLAMTETELVEFRAMLAATRTRVLVKPHPMSVHYGRELIIDNWLWVISDSWLQRQGVTLYEALGQMDALVTDVSSVYVDFLCLNRSIFFYFPDIDAYRKTRTFQIEPVENYLAGPLCTSAEDLTTRLQEYSCGVDTYKEQRTKLATLLNPQDREGATNRLFQLAGITDRLCAGGEDSIHHP